MILIEERENLIGSVSVVLFPVIMNVFKSYNVIMEVGSHSDPIHVCLLFNIYIYVLVLLKYINGSISPNIFYLNNIKY